MLADLFGIGAVAGGHPWGLVGVELVARARAALTAAALVDLRGDDLGAVAFGGPLEVARRGALATLEAERFGFGVAASTAGALGWLGIAGAGLGVADRSRTAASFDLLCRAPSQLRGRILASV
ncbi:MAG TPA: hypothetical protein DCQ06_03835 [Myxococcales bacterium]|nr:hypothetical protein [Myxococcales bacterium]